MKYKLSALTLALLPLVASATVEISANAKSEYRSDSIIVVYKKDANLFEKRAARLLVLGEISDSNRDEVDDKLRNILNGRMAKIKLNRMTPKVALEKLKNNSAIEYAEPDYIVHATVIPDDTSFDSLWGMHNTGQTGGTDDADIDAPEAWDISIGSREVVVGVIDTGIDYTHPDLANNAWVNPGEIAGDGIDNDGNGFVDDIHGINAITGSGDPMDDNSHGTHVSGTIGAEGNNTQGVVGVNHQVSIVGCKFLDSAGSGSTSDAIACIDYMVNLTNNGTEVRALNNSWGGGGFSQSLADAITTAENANILFVAAAGNDAVDNDASPSYPASYENDSVLAVASTTDTDAMSSFSQYGLTSVDMGAPGSAILSTVPGGGYDTFSGTSMATPHVTGAAALVLSVNPELSALELKNLLMNSGDDNADLAGKTVSGKRLNILRALEDADPAPGFRMNVSPSSSIITAGETATYIFNTSSVAEYSEAITLSFTDNLGTAMLSSSTVTPGESFTLTVPTAGDTAYGEYEFTVTGTSGELVKVSTVKLFVNPQGLQDFTYTNDIATDIPDNDANGVSSIINIVDDIAIFDSSTHVNITHTWVGDLTITLTSPAGTMATLRSQSGGSADDINESYSSAAFNGESTQGDWTINVADAFNADTGTLNEWSITFTGLGDVAPAAPVTNFTFEATNLAVQFTDTSTDVNGDISQWSWDFADGTSSTDQNPMHTFPATGNYDVTLTVTDADGQSSSNTMTVSVSDVDIELALKRAYKSRLGNLRIDILWNGSPAETVDIYRNGVKIDTVDNNGIYRDSERRAQGNQFIYQICDASTACSNEITVNF